MVISLLFSSFFRWLQSIWISFEYCHSSLFYRFFGPDGLVTFFEWQYLRLRVCRIWVWSRIY